MLFGSGFDGAAIDRFEDDPNVGLLPSYDFGPYSAAWSLDPADRPLRLETGAQGGAPRSASVVARIVRGGQQAWVPVISPGRVADDHL
jgi:hypothetical protein